MRMNFLNLLENELDQHIYRIMPEKYVISLFTDRENVLSQVHNWKDKFENFQLNLGGYINGEGFEFRFRDNFVGQCWTREYLSEAMWGIYANDPKIRFIRIRSTPRKLLSMNARCVCSISVMLRLTIKMAYTDMQLIRMR